MKRRAELSTYAGERPMLFYLSCATVIAVSSQVCMLLHTGERLGPLGLEAGVLPYAFCASNALSLREWVAGLWAIEAEARIRAALAWRGWAPSASTNCAT